MSDKTDAFERGFQEQFQQALDSSAPECVMRPSFSSNAMACIVLDKHNVPFWRDQKFDNWIGISALDFSVCADVRRTQSEKIVQVEDREGRPMLLVYAPALHTKNWPTQFTSALFRSFDEQTILVGALSLSYLSDDLFYHARALGMTNLEAHISTALMSYGSLRRAAIKCNVTYNTARSALSDAMKKANVNSQTLLVRKLSTLSTAVTPPGDVAAQLLVDIFDLQLREAQLALLMTEGHTRANAAKILGISQAVAKDCFSRIFENLGISKIPELPRVVMDAFTAALLIQPNNRVMTSVESGRAPLRLFQRDDNGLIAISDYGPDENTPVLLMHSSLSTRHPFRKLVSALQAQGYRPITIDRPGFGLTDICKETEDPFDTGSNDIALVCKQLGIKKLHMITRGGAFAALAAARSNPHLFDRVIVINPDLLQHHCTKRRGSIGIIRTAFDKFPNRIEGIAGWAAAQLTQSWTDKIILMAIRDSEVDVRAFKDPDALSDYRKSILVFGSGRISGFIREQRGYALLPDVEGLPNADNWHLIIGESDPTHYIKDIVKFWKKKIPRAKISRPKNAGRYLELSHTETIVMALSGESVPSAEVC